MSYKIKNIVFDLGGVLIDFNPSNYLKLLGFDQESTDFFVKLVFYSEEWNEYNKSNFDKSFMFNILLEKYPQYSVQLIKIYENIEWKYILYEVREVADYLKSLKSLGYNIYILSDLSEEHYNFNKNLDFFNYIDGGVYSFEIGTTKPSKNNYEVLLKRFLLVPQETIFIDDRLNNVEASKEFGIHGIQFDTLDEVKVRVKKLLS